MRNNLQKTDKRNRLKRKKDGKRKNTQIISL